LEIAKAERAAKDRSRIARSRANEAQRAALLRILSGQDTEPGATVFNVFASTLEKVHEPIFAPIEFELDTRRARLVVPGVTEGRGEPIQQDRGCALIGRLGQALSGCPFDVAHGLTRNRQHRGSPDELR
jgi:hypothetical protein